MIPAAFVFSSRVWETATFIFVVVPLTLLWVASMADTVLRKDLLRHQKFLWLVVIFPFPIIGTLIYVFRRPGLRERATSIRDDRPLLESRQMATETLDNFAVTMGLTQSTLKQSSELLDQVIKMLSEAGSTAGFALPLTNIRPLGPVEDRVRRLVNETRMLKVTMERMSLAVGTNAQDLRSLARQIDKLALPATPAGPRSEEPGSPEAPGDGRSTGERSPVESVYAAGGAPNSLSTPATPAI